MMPVTKHDPLRKLLLRSTQAQLLDRQIEEGRINKKTLLLALEEQMVNFAKCINAEHPEYARIIRASANVLSMHAFEHGNDWWSVAPKDRRDLRTITAQIRAKAARAHGRGAGRTVARGAG